MKTIMQKLVQEFGKRALEELRINLVLPFVRESAQAKAIGWTVEDAQLIEALGETEWSSMLFPLSIHEGGNELMGFFDNARFALLNNADVTTRCEEMAREARMDSQLTREYRVMAYSLWRMACRKYLYLLAKSSDDALKNFTGDSSPYKLYGAIMALSLAYKGEIDESTTGCLAILLAVYLLLPGRER